MIALTKPVRSCRLIASECQDEFLTLLPAIRNYAHRALQDLRAEAHEDAVAEVIANAFVAYVRLVARGKADLAYPTVLARFAVSQFHAGRRVGNRFTVRDVMSKAAQRRHGFVIERLGCADESTGEWVEALVEDTATPIPDQAAFRCDFPAWLRRQKRRNRRIAEALSLGHTTAEVARQFHVSAARVSQLRREFHDSWLTFHGEQPAVGSLG